MTVETGRGPAISYESFKTIAHSRDAANHAIAGLMGIAQDNYDDVATGRNAAFASEIKTLAGTYRTYIKVLESVHEYYAPRLNVISEESGRVAAFVIYAKIIRLLNMALLCLESGYWESLILLRPIDEAVHLAEYFALCGDDTRGATRLRAWFRENNSPRHSVLRRALSEELERILGGPQIPPTLDLLNELYDRKSKALHHTYNSIWETHRASISGGVVAVDGFDYGPISNTRKLWEITSFFRSSIWTAVQGFVHSFIKSLPLERSHIDILMALDRQIGETS
ncbi:hypothetical protein YTPLAS18_17040 [Nitrospira sp.]|nr:hypothetical protein YTPLAS18_17040 [Nitrospira sp.]